MIMGSADASDVELIAGNLTMFQNADLNLFFITESRLVNWTYLTNGVKMEIKLKRKITREMMTTYLPSILLMMITFATTFFKPFFFEAALSVNLTTMLVMTTIFISKMESLPNTSDIKMIDSWLILCQLVPFAQVVLLTAMEYLREEEGQEEKVEPNKEVCPKVVPSTEGQNSTSHLDVEKEIGVSASNLDQPLNSKAEIVTKLVAVGEY